MRLLVFSVVFTVSFSAFAQECESLVALSKLEETEVSERASLEQEAANFCNEYSKTTSSSKSNNFGAKYKILSASFGSSSTSDEQIANKYCSDSNKSSASKDAYSKYVESIAPGAYQAYESCIGMKDLKFSIDPQSILPKEFSLSVSFTSSIANSPTAKLIYSTSSGINCEWSDFSGTALTINTGSTTFLKCSRKDNTQDGFVKVVRQDGTSPELTIPWKAHNAAGEVLQDGSIPITSGSCQDPKNTDREGYNNKDCTWLSTYPNPRENNSEFQISVNLTVNMTKIGCNDPHRQAELFLRYGDTTESRSGVLGMVNIDNTTQEYSLQGAFKIADKKPIPIKVFINPRGCTSVTLSSGEFKFKEVRQ